MSKNDIEIEKTRQEQELRIQRQIAFATGLFQENVTIRTLLESLIEGVVVIDISGTILLVNAAAEQMFGYQSKELIGKPQAILIPERFLKVHEEHEASYFKKPRTKPMGRLLDITGRRSDGSEFPVEISLSFVDTMYGVLVMALISDVTLRKQFESRLCESEAQFHLQVEEVRDYAIFMLDTEGNVQNWNAGAERLKGYRADEIIGAHFSCFYPEEARNAGKPEEELKKAAAEGRIAYEGWRVRKDGSRFWADVTITALSDESGSLRGFSKVTHDITERKKAADALRFSEARYRALFHDNPTMIVTLDTDLTILSANQFCANQLGYTVEELEGQSVLKLFHGDDRAAVAEQLRWCLKNPNQVNRWQYRKIRKNGDLLWVEETAQAVHDLDGALNLLVVCQDITERKRAEEDRERLLLQLEAVLESINNGVVISDLEGNVLIMNKEILALYEYENISQVCQPLSKYQDSIELFDLEGRSVPFEQWPTSRALREERFIDWEVRVQCKNSGKIWIGSYSGTPVRSKSGELILSVITVRDITERKSAEEKIAKLNMSLTERAADLEDANRELEAFNYTVAHDLRKPLTVVNSYCQAIQELCGDQLNEACKDYLREAYNGTWRMNQLIDALLNFSRLAHVEMTRETVDLSAMAHEIALELKMAEPERRVTFLIAEGVSAASDATLLRVGLDNLLGNAWKFTVTRDEGIIEFGTTEVDGKPAYFVRDNGPGFDMAYADKLFVPFQRLPGTEECSGFGIGLATVERIIRRHGGRVWAEGAPGKGACFYFILSAG
jgi:PAS domain S-box-containing protein